MDKKIAREIRLEFYRFLKGYPDPEKTFRNLDELEKVACKSQRFQKEPLSIKINLFDNNAFL